MFSRKSFFLGTLIGFVLLISCFISLPDGKLHLVFCDVGQGDAAYIRTPSNQDVLIDGGPNDKVLSCLGKNMPFYDRTLDLILLSHPQKDHYQGLSSVIERYNVKYIVMPIVGEEGENYKNLREVIRKKNIPLKNLYSGDKFLLGKVEFAVLWPQKEWVLAHLSSPLSDSRLRQGFGGQVGESRILGASTNLNYFSQYVHLKYGSFDALFTGDGDNKIQPEILKDVSLPEVEVLKFPHHGSKYGALAEFLDKVKPTLAVISVGKNPWGHPTQEALKLLSDKAIRMLRTDRDGEIRIVSDGKNWVVD